MKIVMKSKKHQYITVLDMGSFKTVCVTARIPVDFHKIPVEERLSAVTVLAASQTLSQGIKNGGISDFALAQQTIHKVIEENEIKLNAPIDKIWINFASGNPKTHYVNRKMMLDGFVTQDNIDALHDYALEDIYKNYDYIVHAVPLRYMADTSDDVLNPVGMRATQLEVQMMCISADLNTARNWGLCIEKSGSQIAGRALSPYVSALGCLSETELKTGVICVDIGGDTTSISAFSNHRLIFADMLPIGGNYITRDIAQAFSVSLSAAENLKCTKGTCQIWGVEHDRISLPVISEDIHSPTFETASRADLVKIIRLRIEEIIQNIQTRLKSAGLLDAKFKLVFTGGTSQLSGLADLCYAMINMKPRIAYPVRLSGVPQSMSGPAYSALTGLIHYAVMPHNEIPSAQLFRRSYRHNDSGVKKMLHWLKYNF